MQSISNAALPLLLTSRPGITERIRYDVETGDPHVTQAIIEISNSPNALISVAPKTPAENQGVFSRLLSWFSSSRLQTNAPISPQLRGWDQSDSTRDEEISLSSGEVDMEAVLEAEMQRKRKPSRSNKLLLLGGFALITTVVGVGIYNRLRADTADTPEAIPTPQPWASEEPIRQSSTRPSRLYFRYNFGIG